MGGNSTLHSTVSSDSVRTQEKFDLKSWQGLTELLKAGKDALKPEAYAEFRNLVLSYAQHGGDLEYKKRIDDVVATFGRVPVAPTITSVPEPVIEKTSESQPTQSSRRVAPRFDNVSFMPTSLSPEEIAVEPAPISESVPEIPAVSEPTPLTEVSVPPISIPSPEPIPAPEPVPSISEPVISESILSSVAHTPEIVTPSTPAVPEVPLPPKPAALFESEPQVSEKGAVPFRSLEECKMRIAEIKRAVNAHFGNPVALMAVPNNLGKVYMTALLSALKAATPGAPGGVEGAMIELERAYKALMEGDMVAPIAANPVPESVPASIPENSKVPELSESIPEPEPPPAPPIPEIPVPSEPKPVPEPDIVAPLPEAPARTPASASKSVVEQTTVPEISPDVPTQELPLAPLVSSEPKSTSEPVSISKSQSLSQSESLSEKDVERMSILERIESEQGLTPRTDTENSDVSRAEVMHSAFEKTDNTISAVVSAVHKKLPPISGSIAELVENDVSGYDTWQGATGPTSPVGSTDVSDDDVIHRENKYTKKGIVDTTQHDELQEQGIDTSDIMVKQSELASPQITTMLDKLLHEWSIFGGSGFFGIGPGGMEHPLFKKLSTLSMGEVVAGRFDGADPKTIKIIKQYVDAWRHEQGITYTPTETFEHYLRRVVQRIAKRQST